MARLTHNFLVALVAGMALSTSAVADVLTPEARKLAHCEGVYIYAAQMAQLLNNNGAALNFLSRASRATTANFFLNRRGDGVPGETIRAIKASRAGLRERLDSNQTLLSVESTECDRAIPPIFSVVANYTKGENLGGKSFVEFNQYILDQYKKGLGL